MVESLLSRVVKNNLKSIYHVHANFEIYLLYLTLLPTHVKYFLFQFLLLIIILKYNNI